MTRPCDKYFLPINPDFSDDDSGDEFKTTLQSLFLLLQFLALLTSDKLLASIVTTEERTVFAPTNEAMARYQALGRQNRDSDLLKYHMGESLPVYSPEKHSESAFRDTGWAWLDRNRDGVG